METRKEYKSPTTKILVTNWNETICNEETSFANPYLPSLSPEQDLWDDEEDDADMKSGGKSKWDE